MKIAVSSKGTDLDAEVDPRFGRCQYLLFVDTDTLDYEAQEKLTFYGSFITDYSAAVANSQTNLALSTWDIYHLSGGAAFSIGRSEFTLGVNYAFGSDTYKRDNNRFGTNVGELQGSILDGAKLTYRRLKFLLGFSIQF